MLPYIQQPGLLRNVLLRTATGGRHVEAHWLYSPAVTSTERARVACRSRHNIMQSLLSWLRWAFCVPLRWAKYGTLTALRGCYGWRGARTRRPLQRAPKSAASSRAVLMWRHGLTLATLR